MENKELLYIEFERKAGQIFNEDIGWLACRKQAK